MIKVVLMIEIRKLFTLLIVATLECKTLTFFLINNLSKKKNYMYKYTYVHNEKNI